MGIFVRADSPFWWMLLEGTGRQKESTGIPRHASDPEQRKRNKLEAEAVYHGRMIQLARQRVGLPSDRGTTFNTRADWYERHKTPTHKGQLQERSVIAQLRSFFGAKRLTDIRPSLVAEYDAKRLKDGLKLSSVNREVRVLCTILNSAIGEDYEVSPLAGLRRRRARIKPKRTITSSEEPALLEALRGLDLELHDLYVVGVGTLLRQENLISLKRSQHRQDRLVVDTKTGPHSVILTGPTELQTRAAAVLLARWPSGARDPFFPSWSSQFAGREDLSQPRNRLLRVFRKAIEAVGLPWGLDHDGLVWHTATRASGATRLLREYGVDIRTVQLMGPWSSLDQMAEYLGHDTGPMHDTSRYPKGPLVP